MYTSAFVHSFFYQWTFWSTQLTLEMWLLFYIFTPSFLYKLRQKIHLVKKKKKGAVGHKHHQENLGGEKVGDQEFTVRLYYIGGHCLHPHVCPDQVRRQSIVQW